eukprot:519940_1
MSNQHSYDASNDDMEFETILRRWKLLPCADIWEDQIHIPLNKRSLSQTSSYLSVHSNVDLNSHWCYNLKPYFKWINLIILYYPMRCTIEPYQKIRRSKYWNNFFLCCIIIGILYHSIAILIWFFDIYFPIVDQISQVVYILFEISVLCARITSLYYFYSKCDFPWMCTNSLNIFPEQNISNNIVYLLRKYMIFIKIIMLILFIADFIQTVMYVLNAASYQNTTTPLRICYIIMPISGRLFIFWPNYITFSMISFITLKYKMYFMILIDQLYEMSNQNTFDFGDILQKYQSIKSSFSTDYNSSGLKWFVLLMVCAYTLRLWSVSYEILSGTWESENIVLNVLRLFCLLFAF